ncbi:MAG TPA: O-antigen ligase family protein [Clostridia bacterium]|nr:O-antigen ligase family protein [Clostridia bacterium]
MPVQNLPEQQIQVQTTLPPPAEAGRAQRGTSLNPLSLQQKFLRLAALLTTGYLCAMFLGHPLVFTNYYYNITESKQGFFLIATGLYLLALLFARIALPPDYGVPRKRAGIHPAAIALVVLFSLSLVGSLISRYSGEAFYGENNRYQGLLTLFCYAGLVFALSRREIDLKWPERAFLLASCVVSVLAVLHHFGVDPIGFTTNLRESDRGRFLSTIGNADFYAAYVVLAFSVALGYFLRARSRNERLFATAALALTSFGTLVAGSDSAALGVIAAMLLVPLLLFSDAAALRRFPLAWAVFLLCAFLFGLLSAALPSVTFLSSFFAALLRPALCLPLLAVSLALWLALRRVPQERLARAKRPYGAMLAVAFLLGAIVLVLLNTWLRELPLGGWERYLRFSESWGTDRGKIWTFVLTFYEKLPFAQKLFGASSGALFHADAVKPLFSDAGLDTAHNEYLQYLVTNGLLGLLSYLTALVFAIRAGLRRGKTEPVYRGLTLAVTAYAVQAAVNIAQPMTTPLLIVLVGVLVSRKAEDAAAD